MTEDITASTSSDDPRVEVLQAAVDRVGSYQDGATPDQVRDELQRAVSEAGIDVDDHVVTTLVEHITSGDEHPDVAGVLAGA